MSKHAGEVSKATSGTQEADSPFPNPLPEMGMLEWDDIILRLALAAAFGLAAGLAYFLTQRKKRSEAASFVATMVLLAILLGMVSMVIGSNIARAFALVGALSIVRFRTVVEDTRDTAFVIFAVVVGMAAGSGAYSVAALGIPIVEARGVAARVVGSQRREAGAFRLRDRRRSSFASAPVSIRLIALVAVISVACRGCPPHRGHHGAAGHRPRSAPTSSASAPV